MLIRIPIGPLLILEDGLNPRIGSALLASFSSISPIGFMIITYSSHFMNTLHASIDGFSIPLRDKKRPIKLVIKA